MKLKLGCDLDGCLFDFVGGMHAYLPSISLDPTENDVRKYLKSEREMKLFNSLMGSESFFENLRLLPGVEEFIPFLNKFDYVIITARPNKMKEATYRSLDKNNIHDSDTLFTHKKGQVLIDYDLDVMIEDQLKYAKQAPTTKIVLMPIAGYNRGNKDAIYYSSLKHLKNILESLEEGIYGNNKSSGS